MDWIVQYFNLGRTGAGIQATTGFTLAWQLGLYGVLVLGVLANGYLTAARTGRRYRFSWRRFVVSVIIGLVIFPAVYKGAQANLGEPHVVQLALVFATGLGYESLFSGIVGLAEGQRKRKSSASSSKKRK